jgi:uncharacterized protein YbaA (DUF1428 family)
MSREFPKNKTPEIALPTVGRIVYVYRAPGIVVGDIPVGKMKPMAAMVADVLAEGSLTITVACTNHDGSTGPLADVHHISEAGGKDEFFWDWMPYQKGQAAKTEALEKERDELAEIAGIRHGAGPSAGVRSNFHDNEISKTQSSTPSPEDGKR